MHLQLEPDPNRLEIFHEGRKRRIFVGDLIYRKDKDIYELIYNQKYANSKNAIPLGPEIDLFKLKHQSKKGQLFPSFQDRIPEKSNPAYKDYCKAQGIELSETNPIILLGFVGRRGPSNFIFEPVYKSVFNSSGIIELREKLRITQHDFARALGISKTTLQRIESGISKDLNTLKILQILIEFPEVALWQLQQTGSHIHKDVLAKLLNYFHERKNSREKNQL